MHILSPTADRFLLGVLALDSGISSRFRDETNGQAEIRGARRYIMNKQTGPAARITRQKMMVKGKKVKESSCKKEKQVFATKQEKTHSTGRSD